jgi:hypothetical protein
MDPAKPGVQRTFAFFGSYNNGLHIVDVSDPAATTLVNSYDCGLAQGDVQVFTRPDYPGRTFVAFAADDGYALQTDSACVVEADKLGYKASEAAGKGTFIIDVTDPVRPFTVSFVAFERGSHNQTVHPSGKYLYNSNSDLVTSATLPAIEVVDITDLTKPKQVAAIDLTPLPGLGSDSHDISFNADGTRAYSAAVSQAVIIDTTDPANPSVISTIFDPTVNVWHQAEATEVEVPGLGKRTVLIGADEFAGATGTGQCPNGALHVYDITEETAPVPLGYFNIDEVRGPTEGELFSCTAHVYQLHREAQMMIIGWYAEGFRVLDLESMAGVSFGANGTGILEIGSARLPDSYIWAAKAVPGSVKRGGSFNVYANDEGRGADVFRFDGSKTRLARGWTFTPAGSAAAAPRFSGARLVCRLD